MDQSSSCEVDTRSASEVISRILLKPEAHYRVKKRPPLFAVLSQMNSVHNFTTYLQDLSLYHHSIYIGTPAWGFGRGANNSSQ